MEIKPHRPRFANSFPSALEDVFRQRNLSAAYEEQDYVKQEWILQGRFRRHEESQLAGGTDLVGRLDRPVHPLIMFALRNCC